MIDPISLVAGVAIVLCILGIFFFSLSEAAMVAISDVTLRKLIEKGDRRAEVVLEMTTTGDYLSTLVVGINFSVILTSTLMTLIVHHELGDGEPWRGKIANFIIVGLILVAAELTPKTYGSVFSERLALQLAGPVRIAMRLAAPLTWALNGLCSVCLRVSGAELLPARHLVTQDEIRAAADIGEEEGIVEPEGGEILDSLMELSDLTVRQIMVPRVDMVALPVTASTDDMIGTAVESGFSRIPVYTGNIDHIIGILYVNDLLLQFQGGVKSLDLWDIAREPFFVPEFKRVWELLREMRERKVHIAVVIDEYGGTEGIVSIEDILEELVGEIRDEHDVPQQDIVIIDEGEAMMDANARIVDVNDALGLDLPSDEYETMGGLVTALAGRIPSPGDSVWSEGVQIEVAEGDSQRLERLRVVAHGKSAR